MDRRVKDAAIALGLFRAAKSLRWRLQPELRRLYEARVRFYRALLPPRALCFDVGAHIGENAEAMLGAGARVVAFEPQPRCMRELRARCAGLGELHTIPAAVGSTAGIAVLHLREKEFQASLVRDWEGAPAGSAAVPVVTLDDAIAAFGVPDYCKIDVEGFELEVLRGVTRPLSLVSFEYHSDPANQEKARACVDLLVARGMSRANVVRTDGVAFAYADWIPADAFARELPRYLVAEGSAYGDVYMSR